MLFALYMLLCYHKRGQFSMNFRIESDIKKREGVQGMILVKTAIAGTLESSDTQVTIEPGTNGIELALSSSVINSYGRQIKAAVLETLERLEVANAKVTVVDKGALDSTIRARVECAVFRACEIAEGFPWGGCIR